MSMSLTHLTDRHTTVTEEIAADCHYALLHSQPDNYCPGLSCRHKNNSISIMHSLTMILSLYLPPLPKVMGGYVFTSVSM